MNIDEQLVIIEWCLRLLATLRSLSCPQKIERIMISVHCPINWVVCKSPCHLVGQVFERIVT